jgi:hypothetical protein
MRGALDEKVEEVYRFYTVAGIQYGRRAHYS